MRATSRLIGFTAILLLRRRPVSMPPFVCCRPPAVSWKSVPFQVILPFGYVLLRAPSLPSPLDDLSVRALPARGLGPLHDVTRQRPRATQLSPQTHARVPRPSLRSVLRRSQPLDGFPPLPSSRACFIPQPCPGPILFRGLLSPRSRAGSSPTLLCPLAVVRRTTHRSPGAHDSTPRLRGLAPRRSRVVTRRVIHSTSARSPLQVLCSSRLLPLRATRARLPSSVRS
jgi:hypothetical protein